MPFPYRQNSMSAFLSSPLRFSFFACMASSSQRCFRPRSNHPTWSHIIKLLWGKLIPSESLVFHTFQFKAITHSGLLLQRGLCQAPHHCPSTLHTPTITRDSQGFICHPSPEHINLNTEGFFFPTWISCAFAKQLCASRLFILFPVSTFAGNNTHWNNVLHHPSDSTCSH